MGLRRDSDGFNALGWAAILAIGAVVLLAIVDVIATGEIEPGVLGLVVAVTTPLIPALIAESRRPKK